MYDSTLHSVIHPYLCTSINHLPREVRNVRLAGYPASTAATGAACHGLFYRTRISNFHGSSHGDGLFKNNPAKPELHHVSEGAGDMFEPPAFGGALRTSMKFDFYFTDAVAEVVGFDQ